MPTSKKPRKKYRPKPILKDPVGEAIKLINPAKQEHATSIQIIVHDAMARLTKGVGTPHDWQTVADAINVTIVLCEKGYAPPEWMPDILAARDAMKAARDRHKSGKALLFKGEEIQLVNEALLVHDQQIEVALLKDVEWALKDVSQRASTPTHHNVLIYD